MCAIRRFPAQDPMYRRGSGSEYPTAKNLLETMQWNRERRPNKGGRPRKIPKVIVREDESLTKISNGDDLIQPSPNPPSTDTASLEGSRYRTRHSQAVADELAVGSKRLATKSPVPMESPHSKSRVEAQDGIISPGKSVGPKDVLVSTKLTSDLHAQPQPQPHENNELISDHIDVDGYKVKHELAPLVIAIFRKYGDICRECFFSVESRSILLEWVCSIYKRLEASSFMQLTSSEINSMLGQMEDLKLVKMEIGWLTQRLSQISKAREMYSGVSSIEDVEARVELVIGEKAKAIESYKKQVVAGMEAVKKLQEKLQQEKDELSMVEEVKKMCGKCLVHGLV